MHTLSPVMLGLLLALPIAASAEGTPAAGPNSDFALQPLKVDRDFESGCGCSIANRRDETILFSDLENRAPAIVKIRGQRKELRWVSSTERQGNPRMGDRFKKVYALGQLKLELSYKTTFVCGPRDEACEVTRYKVDAQMEEGRDKWEAKNLEGDCGC